MENNADKECLVRILREPNVIKSIKQNMHVLLEIIPEIKDMIGFEHKHPHHYLDVWKHTLCAIQNSPSNLDVRLALLLHDIGKPHKFVEENGSRRFLGHEIVSAQMSEEILNRLGFEKEYVEYISKLVLTHDTPINIQDAKQDLSFAKTMFQVQTCDALAHNPEKNYRRNEYLKRTREMLWDLEIEKEEMAN